MLFVNKKINNKKKYNKNELCHTTNIQPHTRKDKIGLLLLLVVIL